MPTLLDATEIQVARQIADEAKAGQGKEVGAGLATEYLAMGQDKNKFAEFLKQVQTDNVADQNTDKHLPGLEIAPDKSGNLRVNLTTPGEYFGNLWRNRQEVFADIKTTPSDCIAPDSEDLDSETAIAEKNSSLCVNGPVHVIAQNGSDVSASWEANVSAEEGSTIEASTDQPMYPLESLIGRIGLITAENGSRVSAEQNSRVLAQAGATVWTEENAQVTAQSGSWVFAHDRADIDAQSGSNIIDYGDKRLAAQPGANVMSEDQFKKLYPQYK